MNKPTPALIEGHVYSIQLGKITVEAMVVLVANGEVDTVRPSVGRSISWNMSLEDAKQKVLRDITDEPRGQEIIAKLAQLPNQPRRRPVRRPQRVPGDYSEHPLFPWQSKLEANFSDLRKRKGIVSPEFRLPVYALEHGLSESERVEMLKDLQSSFRSRGIEVVSPPLPWVVYASELALEFNGAEYWPLFDNDFPGLQEEHKNALAILFEQFNSDYRGAAPVPGRWSRHFNRICLPITHSILPKLYQRRLTECLTPLMKDNRIFRNLFDDNQLLRSLETEGERLFPGDKFIHFVQENHLIAEIIWAFFGDTGQSLQIDDTAFGRIVGHLEETFEKWDRTISRGPISDAIRIKESLESLYKSKDSPGTSRPLTGLNRDSSIPLEKAHTALAITIDLRNSHQGWNAEVAIPSLEAWFSQMKEPDEILNKSVLHVNGSDRPRPFRYIERGPQTFPLQNWPENRQPLCKVEPPPGLNPADIRYINRFLEFLSPDLTDLPLLFQVSEDLTRANLIRSKKIRPGQSYILVGCDDSLDFGLPDSRDAEEPVNIKGINIRWLQIPEDLSDISSTILDGLGLTLGKKIQIGPVGLMSLDQKDLTFDWLVNQSMVMGFKADFAMDAVRIWSLEEPENDSVINPDSENRVLFKVPTDQIDVLVYGFEIMQDGKVLESGNLGINVRDAVYSDTLFDSPRHSIQVVMEANRFNADGLRLEDLWQNRVLVEIRGVANIPLACHIIFFDGSNNPLGPGLRITGIKQTPVSAQDWNRSFSQAIELDATANRQYTEADSAEIVIDAGERGLYRKVFPRRHSLVRWRHQILEDSTHMIYLEGNPDTEGLRVDWIDFKHPFDPVARNPITWFELQQSAEPGLYMARWRGGEFSTIVVPAKNNLEYAYVISSDVLKDEPKDWLSMLDVVQGWMLAPIYDDPELERFRSRIVAAANEIVMSALTDSDWARAEDKLKSRGNDLTTRDREWLSLVDFGASKEMFNAAAASFDLSTTLKIIHFLGHAKGADLVHDSLIEDIQQLWEYRPYFEEDQTGNRMVAEFALRMVNAPETLFEWGVGAYTESMDQIRKHPYFLKSARLFSLLCNVHRFQKLNRGLPDNDRGNLNLYERWEWY